VKVVRYGIHGRYRVKRKRGPVRCSNRVFGDPFRGRVKFCWYKSVKKRRRRRKSRTSARKARKKKRVRRCKCLASRRCKRVVRRVYRYKGCKKWWPKPGKYVGNTCGYRKKIRCNANGRRCVVINRPYLSGTEQYRITKL